MPVVYGAREKETGAAVGLAGVGRTEYVGGAGGALGGPLGTEVFH